VFFCKTHISNGQIKEEQPSMKTVQNVLHELVLHLKQDRMQQH